MSARHHQRVTGKSDSSPESRFSEGGASSDASQGPVSCPCPCPHRWPWPYCCCLLLLPAEEVTDGNTTNKNNVYCALLRNGLCSFKNYE